MTYTPAQIWLIIIAAGIGTFLLRYSFLGLMGGRVLPPFIMRLLRYTAVAVFPALAAPLVLWPEATAGQPDTARLLAAAATLMVGVATRHLLLSIIAGAATLYATMALLGA